MTSSVQRTPQTTKNMSHHNVHP